MKTEQELKEYWTGRIDDLLDVVIEAQKLHQQHKHLDAALAKLWESKQPEVVQLLESEK